MASKTFNIFKPSQPLMRALTWIDCVVLFVLFVLVGGLIEVTIASHNVHIGPKVSLSPRMLPLYASYSLFRMLAAYVLSIVFTLIYGRAAAFSKIGPKVLIPILDVLQSVPILSFLPVVMLSFGAFLPQGVALELASIVLIFTSQAWNLTFSWYQSLTTLPRDLRESSAIFGLNPWLRFVHLELSFGAVGLIWNTIMSWAGGWFFLMAAEMFTVGDKDFRLPGLGSFLREAALRGDRLALIYGLLTLIIVIVTLDQLVWRPLLAWAEKFKLAMLESEEPMESWFLRLLQSSPLIERFYDACANYYTSVADSRLGKGYWKASDSEDLQPRSLGAKVSFYIVGFLLCVVIGFGSYYAVSLVIKVQAAGWMKILISLCASLARVFCSLALALMWTLPVGILIGTNRRMANWLQPLVQIAASVPSTALFPVILVFVLNLPFGTDVAAVLLMMMGTQWYLLFNIIAGASSIPQDLKYTSALLQLSRWKRFRALTFPALLPYIITGAITASGGAWNASIVAEYIEFGGKTFSTKGIGALISQSTASGDYPMLLTATLAMVICVVSVNRMVWRRLYKQAEERCRLD